MRVHGALCEICTSQFPLNYWYLHVCTCIYMIVPACMYIHVHVHNAASFVNALYNYTNCFVSKVYPEGTHGHMYTSSHNQYLYTLDSNVT